MIVKFLLILTDSPWDENFYRCGHCSDKVPTAQLERHADDMHGTRNIEVHNDASKLKL